MGLFVGDFRFLISATRFGVHGGSACTIGRQPLFFSEQKMRRIAEEYGLNLSSLPHGEAIYLTDNVLRALGFGQVDVLDISDYEGANLLHDLNLPVPKELHERFDLIVDGGTLEHVFNFPMAIENTMRMLKIDGHLLLTLPANNYCGHGFYQLSPELFFRIFGADNEFEILRIILSCGRGYYHVVDPAKIHDRVELWNNKLALLMVHARKQAPMPDKLRVPQQSDYVTTWADSVEQKKVGPKQDGRLKAFLRAYLSREMIARISSWRFLLKLKYNYCKLRLRSRLSNRKLYVPVARWDEKTSDALGH